jgi:microcystin-dependent protein
MPSTFSPSLGIELIGNGEQASNWGTTTNNNLGTLLEQAIAGVGDVDMSAGTNVTIVTGTGVAGQARNAVLVLVGSLGASCNLTVPTVKKFYAIRNATTGGQNVVVKTSAQVTGVTLANGNTQLMYCDGTNVVLASVPINSTNGNVSVSGNLTVTGSVSSGGGVLMPTGSMLEYGGTSAPSGWLLCNGAAVSRSTYAALFAVLGTAYGVGDGSTTFNVPNRIDRVGVGAGAAYSRGTTGGVATATTNENGSHNHTGSTDSYALNTNQIPAHNHGVNDPGHVHATTKGTTGGQASFVDTNDGGSSGTSSSFMNTASTGISIQNQGGGQGHSHGIQTDGLHSHTVSTIQPYLASNYIIKT